jgi:iron complex transport system substrate-binding protein
MRPPIARSARITRSAGIARIVFAWLAAGFACTAGAQGAPIRVSDDRGVVLSFERPPQRIVSLLPSLTETVCALQACERLVGVDRYSNFPPSVRSLPQLGGIDQVSIEALVRLQPDVVLAARSQRLLERLEALGLKVLALESDRHDDVRRSFATLATVLGQPERGAQAWAAVQAELDRAAGHVPAAWRGRSVYFEIGSGGYAAARHSFVGETLHRLGLGNVAPADLGPFPKLNPEFVLRQQPFVVMATAREVQALGARPGWQGLQAVQAARVCGFEPTPWDALVRPGPRMGEGARLIAECLARLRTDREP